MGRRDLGSEADVIDACIGHVGALLASRGMDWSDRRVVHRSHAEASSLDNAYNAARTRHPAAGWPDIPGFHALNLVVRTEPVTIRVAFAFGLKPIAKAMKAARLIETTWEDGPVDGLGAMVGAWWCDAEAAGAGATLAELDLMSEIGRYDEVELRVIAEVIAWLRQNR